MSKFKPSIPGRGPSPSKRSPSGTATTFSPRLQRRTVEELLSHVPAAIGVLTGPEHRWTYVNDEYVRVTGRRSAADFIGKTITESLPEVETEVFLGLLDEVYRNNKPNVGRELRAFLNGDRRQGQEVYFDFVYQPMRDARGNVEGIFVHAVEVTDKVKARKAIEETAARLNLAQTAAQIGTWEWDPGENIHAMSPEMHRIIGIDASDADQVRTWESRVHPDDMPSVLRSLEEGDRTGSMEFEYRYHHPELGMRWLYCKGSRAEGKTMMLGVVQDVTARKLAHEASQRLAAIVESSDDAIVSKDLNGIVTSWNAAAVRIFGYTAEEMIGQPITRIIPPELHSDEDRILKTIAAGQRIEHFETVRMTKNGEPLEVSLTISPVKDENGRIVGAAKIARDITQRNKAERALRTTERLASVGRMAATVAHEINNPLEAVTNLVYLAKAVAENADVRRYLSAAEEELERVAHLTKQTLGFYRETKGSAAVRVGTTAMAMLAVFSSRARNRGIKIVPEIKADPEILAVPGEIRQIIANLVGNSLDAVGAGGKIRLRVSAAPNQNGVWLTVADNGPGIPESVQATLFEPFFTTKKDVGTGLGLWVCKSIVEKHGGHIRVKSSRRPGKSGTVFSVFLPAHAQEETLRQAV